MTATDTLPSGRRVVAAASRTLHPPMVTYEFRRAAGWHDVTQRTGGNRRTIRPSRVRVLCHPWAEPGDVAVYIDGPRVRQEDGKPSKVRGTIVYADASVFKGYHRPEQDVAEAPGYIRELIELVRGWELARRADQ